MKTREAAETSYWHTTSFLRGLPWRARILMSKIASVPSRVAHAISQPRQDVKSRDVKVARPPSYVDLHDVRKISMLDINVLRELRKAASRGTGGVFDVGPYVGGSTAAMASGHRGKRKHVVIEAGGAYPDQPFLPSLEIVGDLKCNLDHFGLSITSASIRAGAMIRRPTNPP